MEGKLIKISDNKNDLRTKSIEGDFDNLPEVGKPFIIVGESLTEGYPYRVVTTSIVKQVDKTKKGCKISTINSTYNLEFTIN